MIYFYVFAVWFVMVLATIFLIKVTRKVNFIETSKLYALENSIFYIALFLFFIASR